VPIDGSLSKAWDLVPVLFWNAYKLLTDCDCTFTQH